MRRRPAKPGWRRRPGRGQRAWKRASWRSLRRGPMPYTPAAAGTPGLMSYRVSQAGEGRTSVESTQRDARKARAHAPMRWLLALACLLLQAGLVQAAEPTPAARDIILVRHGNYVEDASI